MMASLTFPYPQGDPRNDPVSASTVFFGSRDLFRTSLALNRDGDKWGVAGDVRTPQPRPDSWLGSQPGHRQCRRPGLLPFGE
jgi:hypothetical protein